MTDRTPLPETEICERYSRGESLSDLALAYRSSPPAIRRVLIKHRIPLRPRGGQPGKPRPRYERW